MKLLKKSEWVLLTLIFVYSFVPSFGGLLRVLELTGGPSILPENPRALVAPVSITVHILGSALFCIVGALQFLPSIRAHFPATHRVLGYTVALAGCISAASGIWMTYSYPFPGGLQGSLLFWARIFFGSLMIVFISWAILEIRSRNILKHGTLMIRAYAIGMGASTQSVLLMSWLLLVGDEPLGPLRDILMVLAWVLNLLFAEILIRKLFISNKQRGEETRLVKSLHYGVSPYSSDG